ncbi:MAG: SLC13/DASS family transporter [Bacteroidales bacterium]|nr:SLC13/DASS family transporter [Candidatus Liminaster caballi]
MSLTNNVLVRRYRDFRNPSNVKTVIGTIIALIAYFGVLFLDPATYGLPNLTQVEVRVVAIFLTAAILWISEAIPTWCTSVLIIVVMLLTCSDSSLWCFEVATAKDPVEVQQALGIGISYKDIMATFADPVVMLFMGGFVLAIGVEKVGLDVFLGKVMLGLFGHNPRFVLLGFILVTALFSAFISNTATAAMMLAFLGPVLRSMPSGDGSRGKIALAMAIPLGANIGGIATPIGTPPNGVAMKYLNDPATIDMLQAKGLESSAVTFLDWCIAMTPITLIILAIGWISLMFLFPFKSGEQIELKIEGGLKKGYKTWVVAATFVITIVLWFTGEWNGLNANVVALVPICCLCLTGLLSKKDLEKINWSVLWMVAGGFALGLGFNKSGLAKDLVTSIPFETWPALTVLISAGLICWLLSNFISNSATAALLIPILCAVGVGMGDTLLEIGGLQTLLFGTAMAASLAMTLPISTPPNAIASSTGIISTFDMAKAGLLIGVVGGVVAYLMLIFVF